MRSLVKRVRCNNVNNITGDDVIHNGFFRRECIGLNNNNFGIVVIILRSLMTQSNARSYFHIVIQHAGRFFIEKGSHISQNCQKYSETIHPVEKTHPNPTCLQWVHSAIGNYCLFNVLTLLSQHCLAKIDVRVWLLMHHLTDDWLF